MTQLTDIYLLFILIPIIFFIFTLYSIPIVVAGARLILRTRTKKKENQNGVTKQLPDISIIVPLKNEEKVIARLINALANLKYPEDKKEVILVDDASTDKTHEMCLKYSLDHPEIKLLSRSKSTTKAAALNFAVSSAHGQIIATFDADSVPEPDVLLKAVKYFANPAVAGVQGRICSINAGQNMLTKFISYELAVQFELYMGGKDGLNLYVGLAGTCQFIRKDALEAVGGWNEDCLAEDTELSLRLIEKDHVIKYASDVRTWEESPFNLKGLLAQRARWYRGNIEVGAKFGRLMKRPSLRRFDAEITLFGTFMILLCVVNYFMPFLAFSVPSNMLTVLIAQFASLFTLFMLGTVGVALAFMVKPFRLRSVLWLPFIYAYWGFQSFIAMYALLQIILRRPKRWHKTARSGLVTEMQKVD